MKLAFFISDLYQPFGRQLIKTMEKYAKERKVEMHVFASFGLQDNNILHAEGEKSILYLPNLEQYQCILVAGDTMARYDMHDELMGHLRRNAKCPIIGIRYKEDGCYNVLVHNMNSMREMAEHFLKVHGFEDICFVTGRMESTDAQERLEGYKAVMQEAGLEVRPDMVFEGDYWRNKGPEIVDYFMKARNGKLPPVIICSNDYMALSVCDEVIRRGYRIPEDVCVTGFDDLDEAQLYIPSMTSIKVEFDKMAISAMDMAISLANGKEMPKTRWCETKAYFRGTCGCNLHEINFNKDFYHRQMLFLSDTTKQAIYMQSDFNDASTEEECFGHLQNFLKNLNVESYYVCLKKQDISQDEVDRYFDRYRGKTPSERAEAVSKHERRINLRMVVENGEMIYENIVFDKHEILPKKYEDRLHEKVSIIMPIHSLNETYGYIVFQMEDDEEAIPNERFELLCMYFGDTLRRIYMHMNLLSVQDAMHMYLRDPLTNIYNRRGFEKCFVQVAGWAQKEGIDMAIVSLDMDGLKKINDNYGHAAGDDAIKGIANALAATLCGEEFCARIGGDEFEAVLLLDKPGRIEEFKNEFALRIREANLSGKNSYLLDASLGVFVLAQQMTMAECMHEADILMYEDKRKKQTERNANV